MKPALKDLIRILQIENRTRKQTRAIALLLALLAFTSAQAAEKPIALRWTVPAIFAIVSLTIFLRP